MELNQERARRWIAAVAMDRQSHGRLVARDHKGLAFCWMGSGARCAAQDGYLRLAELGYGPVFIPVAWGSHAPTIYGALAHWIGVDEVWDIRCRLDQLPAGLRGEVQQDLDADLRRRPGIDTIRDWEQVNDRGWPLWLLNDSQVMSATLADVMRIALDVDTDEVPA